MSKDKEAYWLVEGGEAATRLAVFQGEFKVFNEQLAKLQKELGCVSTKAMMGYSMLDALPIPEPVDEQLWRCCDREEGVNFYAPIARHKAGKEMRKRFEEVKRPTGRRLSYLMLGSKEQLFGDMHMRTAGLEYIGDKAIICSHEHPEWKPVPGLRPLKIYEYWMLKEGLPLPARCGGVEFAVTTLQDAYVECGVLAGDSEFREYPTGIKQVQSKVADALRYLGVQPKEQA